MLARRPGAGRYNVLMQATHYLTDHFLIAMPSLADPNFARRVTLVCQHDETGAMGLVINHLSEYTLGEVFRQLDIEGATPAMARQAVLVGGPVQPDRGFVLHDDPRDFGATLRFGNGLAVSTSRDILEQLARGEGPSQFLMTLGYAGWSPGQLEDEIAHNAWLTVPADSAIFFQTPLEQRWQAAARSLGVDISGMSDLVGHA